MTSNPPTLCRACCVGGDSRRVWLVYRGWYPVRYRRRVVLVNQALAISSAELPLAAGTEDITRCKGRLLLRSGCQLRVTGACLPVLDTCDLVPFRDTVADTGLDSHLSCVGVCRSCQDIRATVAPIEGIGADSFDGGGRDFGRRRVPDTKTFRTTAYLGLVACAGDIARLLPNS